MADEPARFVNRLQLDLTLTIGGVQISVVSGAIKAFKLKLGMGGFRACARFWAVRNALTEADPLIESFATRTAIDVVATVDRTFDEPGEQAQPLKLVGSVVQRSVEERSFPDMDGNPVMQRLYEIEFVDSATALWSHHFPALIKVDTTFKEVVEAQAAGLTLTSGWSDYETSLPMCACALGPASFYDWVQWWLDTHNAFMLYDPSEGHCTFVDAKPSEGEPTELPREDCGPLRWSLPEPPRAVVQVLNASTEVTNRISSGTNPDAKAGIVRDILIRSPVANAGTERLTLEQSRFKGRQTEIRVQYAQYPTVALPPGTLVKFGDDWSNETRFKSLTWRVQWLELDARAERQAPNDDDGDESNTYEIAFELGLELSDDPVWRRCAYTTPSYPFFVEGTIVSEQGEEDEGTYQAYQDQSTMVSVYKVDVPLFEVVVAAPNNRQSMPGHFYFPAYKNERVTLAIDATAATVDHFLDWRPGAKLPQDTQGNHLLFGKRDTDETSFSHVYEDGNPALRIDRTHGQDRQIVTIEEGLIRLEAREEETQ